MTNDEQKERLNALMKDKSGMIKWAIIAVVAIVLLVVIFVGGYSSATKKQKAIISNLEKQVADLSNPTARYTEGTKEVSLDVIQTEINNIGELATLEYLYTDAGKFEDPKTVFGINVPFTTKSFIAKWSGCIKAGIQIDKIIIDVDDKKQEILIYLPKAEILSHEIDNDSIETLDEKDGLFNPIKIEDVREFDKISKEAMEERAIESGILTKATESAKEVIEKLLRDDVTQGYTIVFKEI